MPWICKKKHGYPLHGKCRAEDIVYKSFASVDGYPNKIYLGTAKGDFKQRFYNHQMSFNNEGHSIDTTLSKYVWQLNKKLKIISSLKRSIFKSVPAYSNTSKKCQLCLQAKFLISPIWIYCLIKGQSLFQSAATLTGFCSVIISLMIRPEKCPIRNI